jgi:DNA replicative helicase MCM subunit Mcm2 (Cdc46/Mcm family)
MFVENLEDLPEALRGQFVEVEVDGKKGYQDKDSVELKQHLFNVKDENKTLKATREEFEKQQREAAEAKIQQELEAAKKANNLDEVLRIEREKAADAARKAKEEG